MAQKPSIPKGTRDFSPQEVAKRNYIIETIKSNFERFGFQPIETPSFEKSETLLGKYGEEGDRLIFRILNSGDYLNTIHNAINNSEFSQLFVNNIIDKIDSPDANIDDLIRDEINEKRILPLFVDIEIAASIASKLKRLLKAIPPDVDKNLAHQIINTYVKKEFYAYSKSSKTSKTISEKALRYDLTVPFARYVVQHQNELEFPFKRYQIQPVWRADRPQKGRFREFFQCDADVVGSQSLWQEVEFVQLYDAVFSDLSLKGPTIKINHRKILSGFAEIIGESDKLIDFTVALDKLDKIGEDGVKNELSEKRISNKAIEKLEPVFRLKGTFSEKINALKEILANSEVGKAGIKELEFIQKAIEAVPLKTARLDLDVTLARGLEYYTGAIFEVTAPEKVKMGSIGGGGRYDDLTGIFGLKNMSGVGISFGLDRIYLVLEELDLFPKTLLETTKVLFLNFGESEALYCLKAVKKLRDNGVSAELYPDSAKMKKQMNHANKRNIPFVVLAGNQEMEAGIFTLKNMKSGEQFEVNFEEMKEKLL